MKALVILALAAVAIVAGAVLASPAIGADRSRVPEMISIAEHAFGSHCPNGYSITWLPEAQMPIHPRTGTPEGGHAAYYSCAMTLNATLFDRSSNIAGCSLVAHETGHALGFAHSPDPLSIMYWNSRWDWSPCYHAFATRRQVCQWWATRAKRAIRLKVRRHLWQRYKLCLRK